MNKKLNIASVSFVLVIGFGYWKDTYRKEVTVFNGNVHYLLIPFMLIRWGYLDYDPNDKESAFANPV